jgi:hypothetical protein
VSDYIGNLVAKSFNLTTVLQPRLASRFEPLTPLASLASERQFDGTSFDEAVLQDEATQAARRPAEPEVVPRPASMIAPPPLENLPAQNALPEMRDSHRWQVRQSEPDEQHAPPARFIPHISVPDVAPPLDTPIAPGRLNTARNPSEMQRDQTAKADETGDMARQISARPEPHERLAQDRRHAIQPSTQFGEVTGVPIPRPPAPPRVEEADTHVRRPDRTTDGPDRPIPKPVVRHVIETVHRQPAITPSQPPVAPHDGRRVPEPLHESPPKTILQPAITVSRLAPPVEPPQPTPPTIHVTIGRIEVRATPPPPSPRQRPAPAVMSLDDYLKRREGERP